MVIIPAGGEGGLDHGSGSGGVRRFWRRSENRAEGCDDRLDARSKRRGIRDGSKG